MKRYQIIFSGIVQGVGFRFTCYNIAQKYQLKGWVCNCSDGSVELDIEGLAEKLNSFLDDLKQEFSGYIKDINLKEQLDLADYNSFDIL